MLSDQLSAQLLSKWSRARADDIAEGRLSPKTFNNLVNLLSTVLAWARKDAQRYLAHDPLAEIDKAASNQTWSGRSSSSDQIARLLKVATPPEDTIVMLGVYAGLRRGELCALRWEDIDWGDGYAWPPLDPAR